MARFLKLHSKARGTKPGSLILIGDKKAEKVTIRVMQYTRTELKEAEVKTIEEALGMINENEFTWINIFGLHDTGMISTIGTELSIGELVLEDMLNTDHRPRFQHQDDFLFIIAKLLTFNKDSSEIESDQLSIIAGKNYLITLQEKPGKHFEAVRERIRKSKDRIRIIYSDYLAYALLDCMVDTYLDIMAELGGRIENMEKEILDTPAKDTFQKLYNLKRELNYLRRIVIPMRELSFAFLKSDHELIREDSRSFISDLHDHVVITFESIEVYYSLITDQMEVYNSNVSNRANEIMKVLTVFAAIFIPLTFFAGIYGMNFEHIPELGMKYGYLYFWILILSVGVILIFYFRKKKWF